MGKPPKERMSVEQSLEDRPHQQGLPDLRNIPHVPVCSPYLDFSSVNDSKKGKEPKYKRCIRCLLAQSKDLH